MEQLEVRQVLALTKRNRIPCSEVWNSLVLTEVEGDKLKVGLNQKTSVWKAVLVEDSLRPASSGKRRLVELGLLLTEEASLEELQGEAFLEEVSLQITVGGAEQVGVPQKRGMVGGGLVVAPLKKEVEASQVGAQRLVEKVALQVGACQVVVR